MKFMRERIASNDQVISIIPSDDALEKTMWNGEMAVKKAARTDGNLAFVNLNDNKYVRYIVKTPNIAAGNLASISVLPKILMNGAVR